MAAMSRCASCIDCGPGAPLSRLSRPNPNRASSTAAPSTTVVSEAGGLLGQGRLAPRRPRGPKPKRASPPGAPRPGGGGGGGELLEKGRAAPGPGGSGGGGGGRGGSGGGRVRGQKGGEK